MGPSHTVSEINGDFCRKLRNSPTSVYFAPPLTGFPLELGIGAWSQKTRMMGYRVEKEVLRHLQPSVIDRDTDRQTDGQTDRHRPTAKTALKHSVTR